MVRTEYQRLGVATSLINIVKEKVCTPVLLSNIIRRLMPVFPLLGARLI